MPVASHKSIQLPGMATLPIHFNMQVLLPQRGPPFQSEATCFKRGP